MRRALLLTALVVLTLITAALVAVRYLEARIDPSDRAADLRAEALPAPFDRLKPLMRPLPPPGEHDWLARHYEEGQPVQTYLASNPVRPAPGRNTVLLQPLSPLTEAQRRLVDTAAAYVTAYYGLPVRMGEPLPSEAIPATARRQHPDTGEPQVLSTFLLFDVMKPRLAEDTLAVIGLTAEDLYPRPDWNFVFGQASLKDRVGVWSFHRFGDLQKEGPAVLERTLKTAVHELGHMLGLQHCIAYECLMNGSNHLDESDWRPMEPCASCLAKLSWNVGESPEDRYARVLRFYEDHGFDGAAADVKKGLQLLKPLGE